MIRSTLIALLLTCSAFAQIEMKSEYVMGEPIELHFRVEGADPAAVDVDYRLSKNSQSRPVPGTLDLNIWVVGPGDYTVEASAAAVIDGKPVAKRFDHHYTVKPAGELPIPTPVKPLRELVTDAEARIYAEVLTAQLEQVKAGQFTSLEMWQAICKERLAAHGLDKKEATNRILAMNRDFSRLAQSLEATIKELGGASPAPPTTEKLTAIQYIYEQREGSVPPAIRAVIDRLNREKGIKATAFDDDTTDPDGDIPDQYKAAVAESKKTGTPVVVALHGDQVVKSIKNPTDQQVWSLAP